MNKTLRLQKFPATYRGIFPRQRGLSNLALIAVIFILGVVLIFALSKIVGNNSAELPDQAEQSVVTDIGKQSSGKVTGTSAEDTEAPVRDKEVAQSLSSERDGSVPEEGYEGQVDSKPDVQTYNFEDTYGSTITVPGEVSDDAVSSADKTRDIEQQWKAIWSRIESRREPRLSTESNMTPESMQSNSDGAESATTPTDEGLETQTTGYIPGTQVFCGKTEAELYEWYKADPDAAFSFMWNCDDI